MRPGQNKRMRGRNNRKGPNPLTRSYESNGPDVKIRGTAQHVAEKYLQLARDAQASGDPVTAENYLQHAEHYFRIIASAQTAQLQAQQGFMRSGIETESEDFEDEDDAGGLPDRFSSPMERMQPQPFNQPQPHFNHQPQPYPQERHNYFGNGQDRQHDRQAGPERNMQDRPDRGPRFERPFPDRQNQMRDNRSRDQRQPRFDRVDPRAEQPRVAAAPEAEPGLPAFITGPVRVNGGADEDSERPEVNGAAETFQPEVNGEGGRFPLHPRRRRRNRPPFPAEAEAPSSGSGSAESSESPPPAGPTDPPTGE